MKALVWHGKEDIRYETVPDPEIEDGRDALAGGLRSEDAGQRRNAAVGLAALGALLLVDSLVAAKLGAQRSRARGADGDYLGAAASPRGRSAPAAPRPTSRRRATIAPRCPSPESGGGSRHH
nr:hypothetical protein [Pseudomonadota bacterium]